MAQPTLPFRKPMIDPLPQKFSDTRGAYHTIKKLIADGVLKPGERIFEGHLAEKLGVSRTPVREALAMVEVEGLVKSTPKKGTVVHAFSKKEIRDIYALRNVLEGFAVRQAAVATDSAYLAELHSAWRKIEDRLATYETWATSMDRLEQVRHLTTCSRHFHSTILKASGNTRLEHVMKLITEIPLTSTVYFYYTKEQLIQSNQHHKDVIDAIEQREPEAAATIMSEHMKMSLEVLLENLQSTSDN